jgi:hypothetical protein
MLHVKKINFLDTSDVTSATMKTRLWRPSLCISYPTWINSTRSRQKHWWTSDLCHNTHTLQGMRIHPENSFLACTLLSQSSEDIRRLACTLRRFERVFIFLSSQYIMAYSTRLFGMSIFRKSIHGDVVWHIQARAMAGHTMQVYWGITTTTKPLRFTLLKINLPLLLKPTRTRVYNLINTV